MDFFNKEARGVGDKPKANSMSPQECIEQEKDKKDVAKVKVIVRDYSWPDDWKLRGAEQYRKHVQYLLKQPQPAQRSPEWYTFRRGKITASDWATAIGESPYQGPKELVLKKCGLGKPFTMNKFCAWGVKYEEVATMLYQMWNNVKVIEFGCLAHPEIAFLGASPDGITTDGIMLEIKCPFSRAITGKPPNYYWIQVQGQLEVCDLEMCDFLECKLTEYDSKEEFEKDTCKKPKGCVMVFREQRKSFTEDPPLHFEYAPINMKFKELEKWQNQKIKESKYIFKENSYWRLEHHSNVRIHRDREWFRKSLPKLRKFWDAVIYYREHGCDSILPKKTKQTKTKGAKSDKNNDAKEQKPMFSDLFESFKPYVYKPEPVTINTSKCMFSFGAKKKNKKDKKKEEKKEEETGELNRRGKRKFKRFDFLKKKD